MTNNKLTRPHRTSGPTTKMPTGCGNLYITVGYTQEQVPIEVFITLGKAGGCAACHNEALGRMISLALKYQIPLPEIVEELISLACPSVVWSNGHKIASCVDAVGQVLSEEVQNNTKESQPVSQICSD